ncbi:MAG TPA: cyclodeaminase/cyclohydrolase family protein [Gaiellaceae bacterium]|nr:cyclodeaminase/cyclohydrolase family protein [Gaiellaceae bacterium]
MAFLELSVSEWLDELAAARAAPGGGSALAVCVANAAAVVAMAARVSDSGGLVAQAEALRARVAPLAQLDADTYERALVARDTAKELPPERRDWEIGRAFARAAEPPLEIARAAADVAELAAELAAAGSPATRADAVAAASVAAGAARGAVALVVVNLTALEGDPRVAEAESLAAAAEAAAARARREP